MPRRPTESESGVGLGLGLGRSVRVTCSNTAFPAGELHLTFSLASYTPSKHCEILSHHHRSSTVKYRAQTLPFCLFGVGGFFGFIGMYMPLFYVFTYAIGEKVMSPMLAFYLLPILNAGSVGGRIAPNVSPSSC